MTNSYESLFNSQLFSQFTGEQQEEFRRELKYDQIRKKVLAFFLLMVVLAVCAAVCAALAKLIYGSAQIPEYCVKGCLIVVTAAAIGQICIPSPKASINLERLRGTLGYKTFEGLYSASAKELYEKGVAAMQLHVQNIRTLEGDAELEISKETAEFVQRRLLLHRHALKLDFNQVKAAGIFPATMGYDSLFQE